MRVLLTVLLVACIGCAVNVPDPSAYVGTTEAGRGCVRQCHFDRYTCRESCPWQAIRNQRCDNGCAKDEATCLSSCPDVEFRPK